MSLSRAIILGGEIIQVNCGYGRGSCCNQSINAFASAKGTDTFVNLKVTPEGIQ